MDGFNFCGGIVCDEESIITAAHCCDSMFASKSMIVAGEHNLVIDEGVEQRVGIRSIIIHPDYDASRLTSDIWCQFNQPHWSATDQKGNIFTED